MMSRKQNWLVVFTVLAAPAVGVRADGVDPDEVIAKYLQAIGGRDKLDAIKTVKMTGKMIMGGGMEAPGVFETKRPNKVRIEFTFQGMTMTQAYDGQGGWKIMPFTGKLDPEKMSADELKEFEDQGDLDGPLVDYKKKGHQVELVGKEEVQGSQAYKLKVTKKNGDVEFHFLESEAYLPIVVKAKKKVQGSEMELEAVYGDYKPVAGVLFPHSIEQKVGGTPGAGTTISIEKIEANVDLPDSRFVMPEVKKPDAAPEKKD